MFTWTGCELPTVINNGFVYGLHPAEGYRKPWTQVMCSKPSNEDGSTQRITKAEVRMYSECYFRLFHGHYFQSSYPWVGGVCNFHLQWDCRQGDSFFFSQGWQSRISYRSLSCDIPLFRQRELRAVINRRERGCGDTTEAAIAATVILSMHYSAALYDLWSFKIIYPLKNVGRAIAGMS